MNKPSKYWILVGTFFTSVSSIIIRLSNAPALVISAYRMLFTSIMLFFPVYTNNKGELKNINKSNYILCIISGIFLALHYASWIQSLKMTTIANSTVLVSSSPIFVAAVNYFLLKEKVNKRMIVGIIMSLLGTAIIAMGSSGGEESSMLIGNTLAFLGAIFVAGYLVIGGIVRKDVSAGAYVFVVYSVSGIVLFAMCFLTSTPVYPYPLREYILFLSLGFFSSILGHTVYNYLIKYYSSTLISVSTLSEPIFASVFAMILFKEIPSVYTVLGGIIIISGIYYYLMTQHNVKHEKN
ncbi:MAG: DMT family transporter [Tissierellia bacterium]|nr:DMT family transporter [Tissierellia bacterium]